MIFFEHPAKSECSAKGMLVRLIIAGQEFHQLRMSDSREVETWIPNWKSAKWKRWKSFKTNGFHNFLRIGNSESILSEWFRLGTFHSTKYILSTSEDNFKFKEPMILQFMPNIKNDHFWKSTFSINVNHVKKWLFWKWSISHFSWVLLLDVTLMRDYQNQ